MKSSYDAAIDELAEHGLGPLAHVRGPRASRFAKAMPRHTNYTFDDLVRDLGRDLDHCQAANARRQRTARTFRKAYADLATMCKALPAAMPVKAPVTQEEPRRHVATMAKAFAALNHDSSINADQRGRLMLGISAVADRVFAKSGHPMSGRLEKIQAMLDNALANKHAGNSEPVIREATAHIKRGVVDQGDWARLTVLLNEIKIALQEATDGKQ